MLEHQARSAGAAAAVAGHPVPTTARPNLDAPLAATFGHTFAWAAGLGVLAILSAGALALTERSPAGRRVPAPSS